MADFVKCAKKSNSTRRTTYIDWKMSVQPTECIRFNEENIYLLLFAWTEVYVPSTCN